jgi:uncharacterized protein
MASPGRLKLSAYHCASPAVADGEDGSTKRVVFATRTATPLLLSEQLWQEVVADDVAQLPAEAIDTLVEAELLVPAGQDELAFVLARNRQAAADSRTYALVVQPTAYCQMGCVYCGQAHTKLKLAAELQERLFEHAAGRLASGRYDHVEVAWFGAEPLAALDSLRTTSLRLQEIAREHGCTYGASMTTNGLSLSLAVASELVHDHHLRSVTITLDGMAAEHDVRRPLKGGGATFEKVIDNLTGLGRSDLALDIRVRTNVDRENAAAVPTLIRCLAQRGLAKRIQYYTVPVHSWGNDAQRRSLDHEDYARHELEWLCLQIELGFEVGLLPSLKPIVCIAARPEGDVVDATGGLFNCTEVSYVPAYGSPNRFAIGDLGTGEVPGRRPELGSFNDRIAEGRLPCASCVMLPVCGGACPKSWLEGHVPCPSAKDNIGDRLLLDFARSRIDEGVGAPIAADI